VAQPPSAAASDRQAAPPPSVDLPPIPEPAPTHIYLVDRPGVQSQIRVAGQGLTRRHPGYFTSRVVSSYFGGSFSSRLNETIRVKKGLTYGASGGFSAQRLAGEFQIGTFSKTERTVEAVQAIFEELERLREQPPTAEELEKTKAFTLGSFPAQRETPQQVAGDLWLIEAHDLPADYLQKLLAGVAETTADACLDLVRRTVDPDRLVVVVVGPAEPLRAGLEAIAPVTVVAADGTVAPAGDEGE
jgi:zinc protease